VRITGVRACVIVVVDEVLFPDDGRLKCGVSGVDPAVEDRDTRFDPASGDRPGRLAGVIGPGHTGVALVMLVPEGFRICRRRTDRLKKPGEIRLRGLHVAPLGRRARCLEYNLRRVVSHVFASLQQHLALLTISNRNQWELATQSVELGCLGAVDDQGIRYQHDTGRGLRGQHLQDPRPGLDVEPAEPTVQHPASALPPIGRLSTADPLVHAGHGQPCHRCDGHSSKLSAQVILEPFHPFRSPSHRSHPHPPSPYDSLLDAFRWSTARAFCFQGGIPRVVEPPGTPTRTTVPSEKGSARAKVIHHRLPFRYRAWSLMHLW
jgi:hypothetical protein